MNKKGFFKFKNNDYENLFNFLINKKKSFQIIQSNTSLTIVGDGFSYPFFTENRDMKKVFTVVKKIKTYINENSTKFTQDKSNCVYNSCNHSFFRYENEKVYAIDISSCYITIARNIGMISEELFKECFNLKKVERLMVMGMLAYNPSIFVYKDGIEIDCYRKNSAKNPKYEKKNDYSENFFKLVYETDKIFLELEKKLGHDFAFYWVDCVVFKKEENLKLVTDFLDSNNLMYKIENVTEIKKISENSYTVFKCKKIKHNTNDIEEKIYTLSPFSVFEKQKRNEIFKAIKNGDTKSIKKIFFENNNKL